MSVRLTVFLAALACFGLRAPAALPALPAEDTPPGQHRPVVAVVLSGGAALGLAHIGVLKVIEEMGIPVDIVVGTSMGAIVGGLYAAGYSPSDMERLARAVDWQSAFDDTTADTPYSFQERALSRRYPLTLGFDAGGAWPGRGLLGGQTITTLLEQLTVNVSATDDFDLLPRRFRAVAADITNGDQVVLGSGRLADAMRASATIPLLFKPFTLGGRPLVDGGIVDRLPTDVARDMGADIVIAVEVNESTAGTGAGMRTMLDVLGQVSRVLMEANTTARRALSDIVITPDLTGFRRLEFSRAPAIIARGEEETRKYTDQLAALARRISATRPLEPPRAAARGYLETVSPVVKGLRVDGATPENEQAVRRIFSPLLGAPLDQQLLVEAVNDAYQTGRFDEVRFGLTATDAGTVLVVETVPLAPPTAAALLGVQYEANVSQTMYNALILSPGLIVRDLSGKGSQLILDGRVVDTLGAGVEYFQPLGRRLFIDGYLDYSLDRDLFLQGDSAQVGRLDRGPAAGAWAGFLMGQYTEAKAGIAWSSRHYLDPTVPVALDSTATVARLLFAADTRPAAVLPSRGFGLYVGYDQALPQLGGEEAWKRLSVDAAVSFPLSHLLTMGLTFSGGTDFTLTPSAPGVLGPADAFSLRTDSQFRGYQEWDVRGSHKLAGGLDLQLRIPWQNGLGTDLYILGSLDAGNCWTDLSRVSSLHYGADTGLAVRIRRNFQIAARVCWVDSGQVQLSVDLGSFTMDDDTPGIH